MQTGEFYCKRCGSDKGYRSRPRNAFEKYLLPLLLLRPVRCGHCYRRSYRLASRRVREGKGPRITGAAA